MRTYSNRRQLLDRLKWTWGMALPVRQQMDQVLQIWNENIQ